MHPAKRLLSVTFTAAILLTTMSACQKPEGPAERAGKDIDHAAQQVGQEIEKAGQKLQDAAEQSKK